MGSLPESAGQGEPSQATQAADSNVNAANANQRGSASVPAGSRVGSGPSAFSLNATAASGNTNN